jgi:hypothetical protein
LCFNQNTQVIWDSGNIC